ncbi:hypothetical protein TNCV_1305671 [Trichonephila clavipes]|nr:hypothetical protein TNCV_1305671 [Trichonephila clavipes]
MLLLRKPPDRQYHPIKAHEIHRSKRLVVVGCSFEHHESDSTICLGITLILTENNLGVIKASYLSFPSIKLTRGLVAQRLFRVPPCRKGNIRSQISMLSPGTEPRPYAAQQSASPATRWVSRQNDQ